MIRRVDNDFANSWDGEDRRTRSWDGVERRHSVWYNTERRHPEETEVIERVVEVSPPAPVVQESSSFKLFSNGALISICFSIITAISGFVFNLYEKVTTLEYKQQTIFEKIDENKVVIADLRNSIKESDAGKQKLNEHMSSIEETIMELYRQKK